VLYDDFGDDLFRKFPKIADGLEKRLDEWGADEDESDDEEGAKKKGLPEKTKRKFLDPKTWERDGRLVETATRLRDEIGGGLFDKDVRTINEHLVNIFDEGELRR
jgi:type I restriction enzyme M protein